MNANVTMPAGLEFWTADEVAECLSCHRHLPADYGNPDKLYTRLWNIKCGATNPTPLGGDGDNGTVEEPAGRLDLNNDDKATHWWGRLEAVEQTAIAAAFAAEMGGE